MLTRHVGSKATKRTVTASIGRKKYFSMSNSQNKHQFEEKYSNDCDWFLCR